MPENHLCQKIILKAAKHIFLVQQKLVKIQLKYKKMGLGQ